jgi:hypothetical protein
LISHPTRRLLRRALNKELLLDLEDRIKAEAAKAFEMVRDRSGLDKRRARELEGQARFRMMEQGYEVICAMHGGSLLDGGVIPNTELKIFQPFMRFEVKGRGVILALAAMPEPKAIPLKNKSRGAGVSLNFYLSPRLDLDGTGPKIGDVFVVLLVSRDRETAGKIEEIAVGVIDSAYSTFLFYEPLETFIANQSSDALAAPLTKPAIKAEPKVKLKKQPKRFTPPEAPKHDDGTEKSGS